MRLTLEISGGFGALAGLGRTLTVQTASLPAAARHQIEGLAADPAVFEVAAPSAATRTARRYALTIDDGTRRRTIRFSDPVVDARLRALRDLVSGHGTPGRTPTRHHAEDATPRAGRGDEFAIRPR